MRMLVWILLASGCGRFGFGDSDGKTDARSDTGSAGDDATTDATDAACVLGPWGPSHVITTGFSYLAYDPSERADHLELFLTGAPTASYDVLVTTRATVSDPYPEAVAIPGLNSTTTDDANPSLSQGGLALYFTSERSGTRHAYVATRTSLTSPFSAPILVPGIETEAMDSLDVAPDGLALYISHTNIDLTVARRASTSVAFSAPVVVNAEAIPYFSISADELEVYVGGGTVIAHRSRASVNDPFGPSTVVDFGGTGGDPDISDDGLHLLLSGPATIEESVRSCQ